MGLKLVSAVSLVGMQRVGGEINLRGLVDGRVADENRAGVARRFEARVAAGQAGQLGGLFAVDEVELLSVPFRTQRHFASIGQQRELIPGAVEGAPSRSICRWRASMR
jgi:hypothetical protein